MKTKTAPVVWGELPTDGSLTENQIEEMARALLIQMTLAEKINQMSGDASRIWGGMAMVRGYNRTPILAGEGARNGVPGIRFSDGPRGVVMYHSYTMYVGPSSQTQDLLAAEFRITGDA